MKFPFLIPAFLLLLGFPVFGNPFFEDLSKAGTDGPLVIYRNGKVLVKSVAFRDSVFVAEEKIFNEKSELKRLTCHLPSDEKFVFQLKETLKVEADKYPAPKKMIVLSDIEGNFDGFKILLTGAGVMNDKFHWTFGTGHLVMVGDFFDRGLNVTEVLWLIYKLEVEAEDAGGKVHFILGNHEIMNMSGDLRYLRNKYFENAKLMGEPYETWYSADTELGRWLRTKNAMEVIGNSVFCHGGISEEMYDSGLTVLEVNNLGRKYIGETYENIKNHDAQKVFDPKTGIFWFRGVAKKQVSDEHIAAALRWAGVKHMVIGHTVMPEVTSTYSGRVFCIDLFHEENLRAGFMQTLFIEDGDFFVINQKGEKSGAFAVNFDKP